MSFDHLKKLAVKADARSTFTFHEIEGTPVLEVLPATEDNKPYYNAVLTRSRSVARRAKASVNVALSKDLRDSDRELFARHVVRGWKNVRDDKGQDVPFNQDSCLEFLQALPDYMFDDLRDHCITHSNFKEDAADLTKN